MNKDIPSTENRSAGIRNQAKNTPSPKLSGANERSNPMPEAIASEHWEFLLGELVHFIGLFISQAIQDNGARASEILFNQLIRHLEILKKMPGHDGCILIRRTHCKVPMPPTDESYFAMLGNLMVKANKRTLSTNDYSRKKSAYLQGALNQAFKCFADQKIHSLHIQMPGDSAKKIDQLRIALNIVARFKTAVDNASSIRFRCYGRALTFSVIQDASGRPDPNLTLTAALNGLSPVNARELIKQAEAFHTLQLATPVKEAAREIMGSYNQIFSVRSLRSQIVRPPLEVNNLPWLEVSETNQMDAGGLSCPLHESSAKDPATLHTTQDSAGLQITEPKMSQGHQEVEDDPEQLKKLISKYLDLEDEKIWIALESLTADDYGQLEPAIIAGRFVSITHLLYALDKHCKDSSVIESVIDFYGQRLKKIKDAVFSNIVTLRQGVQIISDDDNRKIIVGLVHSRLFDLIALVTENAAARRRMAIIRDIAFDFDPGHVVGLAAGFGLSEKDALHILGILRDCFSARGRFIRPTFEGRIDFMTEFGNAIFEILWCFLKETPRRQDRLDFLNALQLLMDRLDNPKRTTQFLLADICQTPTEIGFTDRNAFSLANILLHQENKELYVDINRTPESVLAVGRKLNREVRQYSLWRLDSDRARMLTKLRVVHRLIADTFRTPPGEPRSFEISFLFALEREAMIFLALVGGPTARVFLGELIERYGKPDSDIYQQASSKLYLPEIMVQLQMVVRSLGRTGNAQDIEKLEALKESGNALTELDTHPAHKLKVQKLMKWISQSINMMR